LSKTVSERLSIQETIDLVFDAYGPILIPYATSNTTQVSKLIDNNMMLCYK